MVFTLAMVLNPRVWKHAQAEIDAVTGTHRLPDFGDRPALPYVDAIIRETLRWWPVVPLGKIVCWSCIRSRGILTFELSRRLARHNGQRYLQRPIHS